MSAIPTENRTAEIEAFLAREGEATAYEEKVALARDVLAWAATTYGESLTIRTVYPRESVARQDIRFGERLHARNPDLCCRLRKVAPLNAALQGYAAWVTGVRRADAATRTDAQLIEWDAKRSMIKINPFVGWSHDEVDRYAAEHGVFLNPLRELGFASIGCEPCTRPVGVGEDPRAGRWANSDKVECGLHI